MKQNKRYSVDLDGEVVSKHHEKSDSKETNKSKSTGKKSQKGLVIGLSVLASLSTAAAIVAPIVVAKNKGGSTPTPEVPEHEVKKGEQKNCSIDGLPEKAKQGDAITVTISPEDGFKPDHLSITVKNDQGEDVEVERITDFKLSQTTNAEKYTAQFVMPANNATVACVCVSKETPTIYTISWATGTKETDHYTKKYDGSTTVPSTDPTAVTPATYEYADGWAGNGFEISYDGFSSAVPFIPGTTAVTGNCSIRPSVFTN